MHPSAKSAEPVVATPATASAPAAAPSIILPESPATPVAKATPTDAARAELSRVTRRSFAVGGLAALAGYGGYRWLANSALEDGIPWPFRRVLRFNESVSQAIFRDGALSPEFPLLRAGEPRANGHIGLAEDVDPAHYKLSVYGAAEPARPLAFDLADIKALPRYEMITELKCVEGWSQVVQWAGARLSDFAARYRLAGRQGNADDPVKYVSLSTPDGAYFVGLDMASAMHPQTLLCYEMNGEPLTPAHGAPLRLAIPLKYGIKNIKRIGVIRFTDQRPEDYWAQRGYDWYAGH